jgi:hypothetical protein
MRKRRTGIASAAIVALGTVSAPSAQAAYVITFQQVGSDVVETGSGALDLTDLSVLEFGVGRDASVDPLQGRVFSGVFTDTNTSAADIFPEVFLTFGPGLTKHANVTSGGPVGFESGVADLTTLFFPTGYISGASLSDSSTYLGATIGSLGLASGEYVAHWGSGDHADTLTVDVASPAVPELGTWAMMLIGFAGRGYAGHRASRKSVALAA